MKFTQRLFLAAAAAASFFLNTASAVVSIPPIITQWDFNSTPPDANTSTGTLSPATGSGTASLVGGTTSTFASGDANSGSTDPVSGSPSNDSGWNITTFAANSTGNFTRGAQFSVSTLGYENIVLNYDIRHSNTSSRYEQVQYTLDGSVWTNIALFDLAAGDTWANGRTVSFSDAANNANFGVRILAAFAPGTSAYVASNPASNYGTTGTWRFDMVTVSGTPIPEPSTYAAIIGALALGFVVWKRRNHA